MMGYKTHNHIMYKVKVRSTVISENVWSGFIAMKRENIHFCVLMMHISQRRPAKLSPLEYGMTILC